MIEKAKVSPLRAILAAQLAGAAVLAMAGPALAEGSWNSSLSGVQGGFESRRWTDKNSDNVSTSVYAGNVTAGSGGSTSMVLNVCRDITALPDTCYGQQSYASQGASTTRYWGDMTTSGNYYFKVVTITGYYSGWSASSITVKY